MKYIRNIKNNFNSGIYAKILVESLWSLVQ